MDPRSAMSLFTATNMICRRGVTSLRQATRFFTSIRILAFESGGLWKITVAATNMLAGTQIRQPRQDWYGIVPSTISASAGTDLSRMCPLI